MHLLRRPLACSWRSLFKCNTTAAVALFYIALEHVVARVFSLTLRPSFEMRFVFAGALLSTLPALPLCVSSLPALSLCSCLCRRLGVLLSPLPVLLPSLLCFCLISASATPLAPRVLLLQNIYFLMLRFI